METSCGTSLYCIQESVQCLKTIFCRTRIRVCWVSWVLYLSLSFWSCPYQGAMECSSGKIFGAKCSAYKQVWMYLRFLAASFYNQPCMSDFVIDILVGSPQKEVRVAAVEQFYRLSQLEAMMGEGGHQATPHQFLLQTLLKARLPFWVTSSNARSSGLR